MHRARRRRQAGELSQHLARHRRLDESATRGYLADGFCQLPARHILEQVPQRPGAQTVNLTGIGSGAANEPQTLTVTAASSNLTLIPQPTSAYTSPQTSGVLSFTPAENQWGVATIAVTVSDGIATMVQAFQVTVNSVNDAPTATDISVATAEDTPVEIEPFPVYASDVDDPILTVVNLGTPVHGTATTSGLTMTYTPTFNFNGTDTITIGIKAGQTQAKDIIAAVTAARHVYPFQSGEK